MLLVHIIIMIAQNFCWVLFTHISYHIASESQFNNHRFANKGPPKIFPFLYTIPIPPHKKKSFRNQINESRFHFSSLCIELLQAASLIAMAKLWIKYGAWSNWEESPRYFIYFYFYFLSFLVSLLNLSCWKYFQKIYLCNHLQIWGS